MIQIAAAENPNTPPESLLKLLDADNGSVRDAAARGINRRTLRTKLPSWPASSDQIEARLAAYRHPAATPESLQTWVEDPTVHPLIRLACLANPSFPDALLEKTTKSLISQLNSPCKGQSTLDEMLKLLPYLNGNTVTAQAALSDDWVERAASTLDAQPSLLWMLLEDPNDTVSQLAAMQLRKRMDKSEVVGNEAPRVAESPTTGSDEDESSEKVLGACPKCAAPVLEAETAYECQNYTFCNFSCGKHIRGQEIRHADIQDMLSMGRTVLLSGFISRTKQDFSAWLELDADGNVRFKFPDHK